MVNFFMKFNKFSFRNTLEGFARGKFPGAAWSNKVIMGARLERLMLKVKDIRQELDNLRIFKMNCREKVIVKFRDTSRLALFMVSNVLVALDRCVPACKYMTKVMPRQVYREKLKETCCDDVISMMNRGLEINKEENSSLLAILRKVPLKVGVIRLILAGTLSLGVDMDSELQGSMYMTSLMAMQVYREKSVVEEVWVRLVVANSSGEVIARASLEMLVFIVSWNFELNTVGMMEMYSWAVESSLSKSLRKFPLKVGVTRQFMGGMLSMVKERGLELQASMYMTSLVARQVHTEKFEVEDVRLVAGTKSEAVFMRSRLKTQVCSPSGNIQEQKKLPLGCMMLLGEIRNPSVQAMVYMRSMIDEQEYKEVLLSWIISINSSLYRYMLIGEDL